MPVAALRPRWGTACSNARDDVRVVPFPTDEEPAMSSHWNHPLPALQPHLAEAAEGARNAAHSAREAVHGAREMASRHLDSGMQLARELSAQAQATTRQATRSARELVQNRPFEAVVLVAGAAFAIGWLVNQLRVRRSAAPARARTRSTARKR